MTFLVPLALAALVALTLAAPAGGRVLLSQQDALALAFPGCDVQRATVYLSAAQVERAGRLAGEPVRSALVPTYAARCGGKPAGTAYFDAHPVRTLPETVMVVVSADGRVRRVEVLSFDEPADYLPRHPWYDQFEGRALDSELRLKRGIRPVTGASLTARATTGAVRRVLALHQVIAEAAGTPAAATPKPAPTLRPAATPAPTARPTAAPQHRRPGTGR
ncbi:MAG TPA: FMN-binding protein [Thermoanaerobaculia bacterium]|jgi:hypothetical protein|nr:FMN-binding protein [Thermoanaerobaculia bacterium]